MKLSSMDFIALFLMGGWLFSAVFAYFAIERLQTTKAELGAVIQQLSASQCKMATHEQVLGGIK